MRIRTPLDQTRLEIARSIGNVARGNRLFREAYSSNDPPLPEIAEAFDSADGTRRFLIRLEDGQTIESVLIPESRRFTFCVSSQVGCALGCTFCLTGQLGFTRNLSAGEIVGQVMLLRREIRNPQGVPRFSVVFMGMGEPLQNYDNVLKAIEILTDDYGLAVPLRRITVSTAGVLPGIERLAAERYFPNLSISLTGTTDEVRNELMPINRRYPIAAIVDAVRRMTTVRRKRVMFEYVMIDRMTDGLEDARRLSALVDGLGAKVNLIPLNAAPDIPYERPSDSAVLDFQRVLLQNGITTFIRRNRGNDVSGACGQLKRSQQIRGQ